jgi:hypothetical protein
MESGRGRQHVSPDECSGREMVGRRWKSQGRTVLRKDARGDQLARIGGVKRAMMNSHGVWYAGVGRG